MTRYDLYWCLGGLVVGGLIAAQTWQQLGGGLTSFNAGRLTGNVFAGVLMGFLIGRLVARVCRKG